MDIRRKSHLFFECVSINSVSKLHPFLEEKKDCWPEKCELSEFYYSLQPSPSSRHIKGVCLHSTICFPSKKKKKFQKNRDVFLTL